MLLEGSPRNRNYLKDRDPRGGKGTSAKAKSSDEREATKQQGSTSEKIAEREAAFQEAQPGVLREESLRGGKEISVTS